MAVAGGSWNSYEERTEKWEAMHPSSVRPPSPSPSFFHVRIPSGDFGEKERKKDRTNGRKVTDCPFNRLVSGQPTPPQKEQKREREPVPD